MNLFCFSMQILAKHAMTQSKNANKTKWNYLNFLQTKKKRKTKKMEIIIKCIIRKLHLNKHNSNIFFKICIEISTYLQHFKYIFPKISYITMQKRMCNKKKTNKKKTLQMFAEIFSKQFLKLETIVEVAIRKIYVVRLKQYIFTFDTKHDIAQINIYCCDNIWYSRLNSFTCTLLSYRFRLLTA